MKPLHRRITKLETAATPKHKRICVIIGRECESEEEAIQRHNAENPSSPILPSDEVMMIVRVIKKSEVCYDYLQAQPL